MGSQEKNGLVLDRGGVVIFYPFAIVILRATKLAISALMENVTEKLIKQSNVNFPEKTILSCNQSEITTKYDGRDINIWFVRKDYMQEGSCTASAYVLPIETIGSPETFRNSKMFMHKTRSIAH